MDLMKEPALPVPSASLPPSIPAAPPIGACLPPFRRRRVVLGSAGALLAAALFVIAVRLEPEPRGDPRFAALVEAVGDERYIEARLSGGFKYGPLRPVLRGPGGSPVQNLRLLTVAEDLERAAQAQATAENLHAWGVARLLLGDVDGAVESLALALEKSPTPAVRMDFAAACLSGAVLSARSATVALRLAGTAPGLPSVETLRSTGAAAARARASVVAALLAADGRREPGRSFNLAIALELAGDVAGARQGWMTAIADEPEPQWHAEAVRRLERLETGEP
jgi:hypothetical protein